MSDSTSPLASLLLTAGQSSKEVSANRLFNAMSPAALFALDPLTTTALTFGLIGGRYLSGAIAAQTVSLTDNTTNYIVASAAAGVVSVATSTTNWNDQVTYVRLYKVVTLSGVITSYEDHRASIVATGTLAGCDLSYTAATRVLASSTGTDATLPLVASADAGLAPASGGGTANFLRADGTWTVPAGAAADLTYTASTRLLASSTGTDATLPLVSSGDAGLAPASGGGSTNFLRADGTWTAPAGTGQAAIQYKDEGSNLGASGTADTVDYTGGGVTASRASNVVTVNVPAPPKVIQLACSDETTALTAGTTKITFRMPFAMTLTAGSGGVRGSLSTAQTSGSIFTVDVNEAGTTILSTKLTIDNTEKTSTTAATAVVISDTTLADDAEITIDIDQVGDGTAKGLKITLIGT